MKIHTDDQELNPQNSDHEISRKLEENIVPKFSANAEQKSPLEEQKRKHSKRQQPWKYSR